MTKRTRMRRTTRSVLTGSVGWGPRAVGVWGSHSHFLLPLPLQLRVHGGRWSSPEEAAQNSLGNREKSDMSPGCAAPSDARRTRWGKCSAYAGFIV